jgi:Y_Y_Y domain
LNKITFFLISFFISVFSVGQTTKNVGVLSGKKETIVTRALAHKVIPQGAVNWSSIEIENTNSTSLKPVVFTSQYYPEIQWKQVGFSGKTVKLKNSKSMTRQGFKIPENSILNVRYLNVVTGLPSNDFKDLTSDDDNNIWAVYSEGIVKLSGSSVTKITAAEGFPAVNPTKVCYFEGSIYVGTFGDGIIKITGDQLTHYQKSQGLISDHIVDIEVFNGNLYASTYDKGLVIFSNGKQFQLQAGAFKSDQIIKHLHGGKDKLRAVTDLGEYLEFAGNSVTVHTFPSFAQKGFEQVGGNPEAAAITTESDGLIFIINGKAQVDVSPHLKQINKFIFTRTGNAWVSSNDAFCLYNGGKLVKKYAIDVLSKNGINAFFPDKQYNIWFASQVNGLGFVGISNFLVEKLEHVTDVNSRLIFAAKDGNTYYSSKTGGLIRGTDSRYQVFNHPNLVELNGITELNNVMYISSATGLFKIENNQLSKLELTEDLGLNTHTNIFKHNSDVYLNNYNYGLIKFSNGSFTQIKNTSTLTFSGTVDKNNTIWIANYDKGLAQITGNQITFFGKQEGSISDMIFQVAVDDKNVLLIATANGLLLKEGSNFKQLSIDNDISLRYNNAVYDTKEKEFWTSTSSEVIQIKKDADRWKVTRHNQNDFIVSGLIKSACMQLKDNRLSFSMSGNMVTHYPFRFGFQDKAFPLKITRFSIIDGKNISWDDQVRKSTSSYIKLINDVPQGLVLNPGNYTLQFNFGSNFWGSDNNLRYTYRLVGLNDKWIGPVTETELVFHNISTGEYTLEIKAENDKGIRFIPIRYKFEITPRFYEYKSSIILFLLLTTALIFFSLRNFVNFNFKNLESYTSISSILLKVRIISIIGFVLFPFLTYYEGVQQKLHEPNWVATLFVMAIAVFTFFASYYSKITVKQANWIAYISYSAVVVTEAIKCLSSEASPVLIIEFSCLLIFSGLIFVSGRKILIFNVLLFILFAILIQIYDLPKH